MVKGSCVGDIIFVQVSALSLYNDASFTDFNYTIDLEVIGIGTIYFVHIAAIQFKI